MSSDSRCGEVPEWSNGAVSKTVEGASLPRVRIPVSPPLINDLAENQLTTSNQKTSFC